MFHVNLFSLTFHFPDKIGVILAKMTLAFCHSSDCFTSCCFRLCLRTVQILGPLELKKSWGGNPTVSHSLCINSKMHYAFDNDYGRGMEEWQKFNW